MVRKRVLFICVHNSARSQMAEGFVNALHADRLEASSGGTAATRVHPAAIKAMAEVGIDISGHRSKSIDEFADQPFDYIVMVCDDSQRIVLFSRAEKSTSTTPSRTPRPARERTRKSSIASAAAAMPSGNGSNQTC